MPLDDAWEVLRAALADTKAGCMSVVSPRALRRVLEDHLLEQKKREGDDGKATG